MDNIDDDDTISIVSAATRKASNVTEEARLMLLQKEKVGCYCFCGGKWKEMYEGVFLKSLVCTAVAY